LFQEECRGGHEFRVQVERLQEGLELVVLLLVPPQTGGQLESRRLDGLVGVLAVGFNVLLLLVALVVDHFLLYLLLQLLEFLHEYFFFVLLLSVAPEEFGQVFLAQDFGDDVLVLLDELDGFVVLFEFVLVVGDLQLGTLLLEILHFVYSFVSTHAVLHDSEFVFVDLTQFKEFFYFRNTPGNEIMFSKEYWSSHRDYKIMDECI